MAQDSSSTASGPDDLIWAVVTNTVERFEVAWNSSPEPKIADFVPDAADVLHIPVLVELIRVDQEHRWREHKKKVARGVP